MVLFLQQNIQSFKYNKHNIPDTRSEMNGDSRVQTRYLFENFLKMKIKLNNSNKSPHLVQQAT